MSLDPAGKSTGATSLPQTMSSYSCALRCCRLHPSPKGTPDFSPPAAGFTSLVGDRLKPAEARRRLKSAPHIK